MSPFQAGAHFFRRPWRLVPSPSMCMRVLSSCPAPAFRHAWHGMCVRTYSSMLSGLSFPLHQHLMWFPFSGLGWLVVAQNLFAFPWYLLGVPDRVCLSELTWHSWLCCSTAAASKNASLTSSAFSELSHLTVNPPLPGAQTALWYFPVISWGLWRPGLGPKCLPTPTPGYAQNGT